eukprot:4574192-Amphidinium_carterae.5
MGVNLVMLQGENSIHYKAQDTAPAECLHHHCDHFTVVRTPAQLNLQYESVHADRMHPIYTSQSAGHTPLMDPQQQRLVREVLKQVHFTEHVLYANTFGVYLPLLKAQVRYTIAPLQYIQSMGTAHRTEATARFGSYRTNLLLPLWTQFARVYVEVTEDCSPRSMDAPHAELLDKVTEILEDQLLVALTEILLDHQGRGGAAHHQRPVSAVGAASWGRGR